MSEELRNSEEYQELLRLKQVQRYKQKEVDTGIVVHPGFSVRLKINFVCSFSFGIVFKIGKILA